MRTRRLSGLVLAMLVSSATAASSLTLADPAHADEAQNRNLAAQLFRAGRDDMSAGNWEAAAAKLQESHRLLPAMGTLLNLAVAQEHLGRTASAYQNFNEVIQEAKASGHEDRLELATAEAEKLKPLLADAIIHVPANVRMLPGLQVTVDGVVLAPALFETHVDYDPGKHQVDATATGKKTWSQTFDATPSSHAEMEIPLLADKPFDPNDVKVSLADAERESRRRSLRTAGWVLVGVGGASFVTSMVFGIVAISAKNRVHDCSATFCSASDADESQSANRDATVANVTFGAGLGIAAVGAAFVFFARPNARDRDAAPATASPTAMDLRFAPSLDPRAPGMALTGRW